MKEKSLVIAQFSDSHLFAEHNGLHHQVNVLENLKMVLTSISENPSIDYIVFTGDLTQDHSEQSYQNFVDVVREANIGVPLLYLAGNHDELVLLEQCLVDKPFVKSKSINSDYWQVQLINSKSNTPSGLVSERALTQLTKGIDSSKHQLLMMHHHPIDVGYFIDKHGLINKEAFWNAIEQHNTTENTLAIACGHVHRASCINKPNKPNKPNKSVNKNDIVSQKSVDVYTCPATSIQFDPDFDDVRALNQGPAYRLFYLPPKGTLITDIVQL